MSDKASNVADTPQHQTVFRFGEFEVDLQAGRLLRRGARVRLREQLLVVLAALLERPGKVVTREELHKRLWPGGVIVDFDLNLNTAVAQLRAALRDPAERPRFIETLPKRGYRFIGKVEAPAPAEARAPAGGMRLVVLPFANLSEAAENEYLSDAFTDELIAGLAAVAPERLGVIARTTAMHYKGSHKNVAAIGRELGVDFVVEGSVLRAEDRTAVNVQLIQVSDQTHLMTERYEGGLRDIPGTVSEAAQAVLRRIGLSPDSGGRAAGKHIEDSAAYTLYLQGRYHMNTNTPEGFAKAKQCFEEAIAKAPEFALAHFSLGEWYWHIGLGGLAVPKDAFSTGVWSALRAIEIDDKIGEAHALLGSLRKEADFNWPEVFREMNRALELNSQSPFVRLLYGISALMPLGRMEEAVAELDRALELDPASMYLRCWRAEFLDLGRDFERGLQEALQVIALEPGYWLGHFFAGHLFRDLKRHDEATAAFRRAAELGGGAPLILGWLGQALVNSGDVAEARSLVERLHGMASQVYVPPTGFAWVSLALGDDDEALAWMERGIMERDPMMVPIKTYPFLDPLRGDARFLALLRKMNLEP